MSEAPRKIKTMDDVRRLIDGEPPDPVLVHEQEQRRREQLKADKQWHDYLCAHPKDEYPAVLEEIKDLITAADWCEELRFAWYDSDVLMNNRAAWIRIFADKDQIKGITKPNEKERFDSEPDPLTAYRGCLPARVDGMSWSLEFDAAAHFKVSVRPGSS